MFFRSVQWLGVLFVLLVQTRLEAQTGTAGTVLPSARVLSPLGLERMWWSQATLNPARDSVRYLVADEEVVIIQATSGMTTAFDAETGKRLWAVQVGRPDMASYPIITNDDYALAVAGMELYGINKRTGDIVWNVRLPTHPSTSPATDDNHVYVGALDGSMYCFNLKTINRLYNENLLPQWSHETLVWRYKTGREITSPAISDGTRVSFASLDRSLYTVTADRRDLIFQFETDAPIAAPLAYQDNWLFLAAQDLNFYCINALNGQVRWSFICGSPVITPPHVVKNNVYLAPDRGGMFSLDVSTGRRQWWKPRITEFVGQSKSFSFLSDDTGNLLVVTNEQGTNVGVLPFRAFSKRVHNVRTDRIFLATPGGMVVGIRERGREFPTYHKFPEKRPIVPLLAPEAVEEPAGTEPTTNEPAAPKNDDGNATDN